MTTSRREMLQMMAGSAAALGLPALAEAADDRFPRLDGELRVDDAARSAAADDFGHIVHELPNGVVVPGSVDDVAAVVRWARRRGRTVAAQGQSHSVYGRAQAAGGIVIDMSALRTLTVDDHRVVVDAGATWSEVLAATLPRGLAPPVLTDYLELSIGGTLTVGGVGATTSRHGLQSDNVIELEVVTGTGERLTCSRRRRADLFDAVRAGLGQAAIITRATLDLIPAPSRVRRFLLTYPDLATLLHDERLLDADGRFDSVQGAVLPTPDGWRYRLDAVASSGQPDEALLAGLSDDRAAAEAATLPYRDFLGRLAALEQLLRSNGQWFHPHPWLTTFLGDAHVESVVSAELAALDPADLGTFGQVVLSAVRRAAVASPRFRLPADRLCYAFNLIRVPATADAAHADRLVRANRAIYRRVRDAGGVLYPVSALPMSPQDWRRHFGAAWGELRRAKRAFDPANILTPGYAIF